MRMTRRWTQLQWALVLVACLSLTNALDRRVEEMFGLDPISNTIASSNLPSINSGSNAPKLSTSVYDIAKSADGSYEAKQWDTGDDNGSTSVVLSNQNDVQSAEDHSLEEAMAIAERKRQIEEKKRKEEEEHKQRAKTEAGRKLNERLDEQSSKKQNEEMTKDMQKTQKQIAADAEARQEQATKQEQKNKDAAAAQEQQAKADAALKQKQEQEGKAEQQQKQAFAQEQDAKYLLQKGVVRPQPNMVLASASRIKNTGSYSLAFWLRPEQLSASWSSLIHKGSIDSERSPALFFYPGIFKLHIRSSSAAGANIGCDPDFVFTQNAWTHVAITHTDKSFLVYFNGVKQCDVPLPAPVQNQGNLWGSSPFNYPAAQCSIADLRYYDKVISADDVGALVRAENYKNIS